MEEIRIIKEDIIKIKDIKNIYKQHASDLKKENIEALESSLKSIETTYQVYTSEYIEQMSNRVALAQAKLKSNPTLAHGDALYKDLMAEMEIDNYNFGVGHNLIDNVNKKPAEVDYNELRVKLSRLGISEDQIDSFILSQSK